MVIVTAPMPKGKKAITFQAPPNPLNLKRNPPEGASNLQGDFG
jgi:hypothetical protein